MTEKKYGKYLLTDLSRNPPHPEVISPIADFSVNKEWGETKFGINSGGWGVILKQLF